MNDDEKDVSVDEYKERLFLELSQLTFKAIKQAKEKDVEAEMLNAIRENIVVLCRYFNGDLD